MRLWPDEYEPLRDEACTMAKVIQEVTVARPELLPSDPHERAQYYRQMYAAKEVTSPAGVDDTVAGVPCRVFRPSGASIGTYLHIHGGGMFLGSPRMNDLGNAALCERHTVTVVSVDYRLAPEHPYPAGVEDCLAVARSVVDDGPRPVVIGGESAGAYFAVAVALRLRDERGDLDGIPALNLKYGAYDLSGTPSGRGASPSPVGQKLDADGSVREVYLPGRSREEARDPAISPLYADLQGMPAALFTVGTADSLLDDSLFMAGRWLAYENDAELAVYPDCVHGFTSFPFELARRANIRIDEFLARHFASAWQSEGVPKNAG